MREPWDETDWEKVDGGELGVLGSERRREPWDETDREKVDRGE